MRPAPVGVEDDLTGGLGDTSAGGGTLLPGESGVGLRGEGTDLLAQGHCDAGEGDECGFVEHFDDWIEDREVNPRLAS